MSVELVVDPAVLADLGGSLRGIGDGAASAAAGIRSAGTVDEPTMAAGIDAVCAAWGGAAELLAATLGVIGTLVDRAAAGYASTDQAIENGFDDRVRLPA
jgi:hypothetical protein